MRSKLPYDTEDLDKRELKLATLYPYCLCINIKQVHYLKNTINKIWYTIFISSLIVQMNYNGACKKCQSFLK